MSYMSDLDIEVKDTLEAIYDEMYCLVPETIGTDERVEAKIAYFVRGLVNTVLKGGNDGDKPDVSRERERSRSD